ncbi:MAG: hypothetical protein AAFR52_15835, partial [Pseudomonadota bacterium]
LGIENWSRVFGEENVLFVPFKDVRSRPDAVMAAVEAHVGLRPHRYANLHGKVHESVRYRVPETVTARVSEIVADQRAYLAERFDADFIARI